MVAYREALALPPDDAMTYHSLGHALRAMGLADEAVAEFRKAAAFVD